MFNEIMSQQFHLHLDWKVGSQKGCWTSSYPPRQTTVVTWVYISRQRGFKDASRHYNELVL